MDKSKPLVSDIIDVKIESSNYWSMSQNSDFYKYKMDVIIDVLCIIPYSRGNSRSVKIDSIFNNIEEAL